MTGDMKLALVVALVASAGVLVVEARPGSKNATTCGYESCHPLKKGVINVHIVPHSHDDVGWLKTVDQLYYGSKSRIQKSGVQYIIDSVVDELLKDPNRRFVYVESFFFDKWWQEQTDQRRHQVKRLVNEGRLEIAGGAWSMNDEATTHYHSVLDQLTWGLRWVNDTFGKCGTPKAGWQIDPFGHSRELASMWALAGFDGLLMGRVDYQDRSWRTKAKELEMIWRGSDDIGKYSDILTGIMYNTYFSPSGFCFDILCSDEPFIDDLKSSEYNVDALVDKFMEFINGMKGAFKTNNLIITMGGDFNYQDALVWYKNLDKLIKYVNEKRPDVNLVYSTPGCYIKSLHDSESFWSTKEDDFFPYSSDPHAFWTGYFTSRPTLKYYERRGNNMLQVCKQLYSLTNMEDRNKVDLNALRSAMGIMQHHDAVTGTEKQHVAEDYARILEIGMQDCEKLASEALNKLMSTKKDTEKLSAYESDDESYKLEMFTCRLNESWCQVSEHHQRFVVTMYNPLGHEVDHYVRLPVNGTYYEVRDGSGVYMKAEVLPMSADGRLQTKAPRELVFKALAIPALGYKAFHVASLSDKHPPYNTPKPKPVYKAENEITNGLLTIEIDDNTGLVKNLRMKSGEYEDEVTIPLKQELLYYQGMAGNNQVFENRASGAYIFRPNGSNPMTISEKPEVKYVRGEHVQEVHQKFADWATQVVRLYQGEFHVEFEWLVGPIPVEDGIGKEIISRFTTDIKSNGVFYTDSNGRQLMKRTRNKRPTWEVDLKEPVAGNYYPVTSTIGIEEENSRGMYVMTDRAQGGGSLKDGQIEIMIHRRLLYDDAFGVDEPLNETVNGVGLVAKGTHYLFIGDTKETSTPRLYSRLLSLKTFLQPGIFLAPLTISFAEWLKNKNTFKGIAEGVLPGNVNVLTLEPWKDRSILLRLENNFQRGEYIDDGEARVDLARLFAGHMRIVSMRETLLAANQWKDEAVQLRWAPPEGTEEYRLDERYRQSKRHVIDPARQRQGTGARDQGLVVALRPMEIRTFVMHVEFAHSYE